MRREFYDEFLRLSGLGLRPQAKAVLADFIASFASDEDRRAWTKDFLSTAQLGQLIPHQIYEAIVLPVLLAGYRSGDSFSTCWLAGTMPNAFQARHLWKRIGDDYPMPRKLIQPLWERGARSLLVRATMLHLLVAEMHRYSHDLDLAVSNGRGAGDWDVSAVASDVDLLRDLDEQGAYEGLATSVTDKLQALRALPS